MKQLPDNILLRGRKIRLLPTAKEAKFLFEIAEGCRKVWNWALDIQVKEHITNGKLLYWNNIIGIIFTNYLNSVEGKELRKFPRKYLESAIRDLSKAYDKYFSELEILRKANKSFFSKKTLRKCAREKREPKLNERLYYPKFKSHKKYKSSFGCADRNYFQYHTQTKQFLGIHVEKIHNTKKINFNYVKIKTNYTLLQGLKKNQLLHIHNARISYQHGKWIFSYAVEVPKKDVQVRKYNLGTDLGIRKEAVIAFANQVIKFKNINATQRIKHLEKHLRHIDRNISRKKNIYKKLHPNEPLVYSKGLKDEYKKRAKVYYQLANIRRNYIHHITRLIIDLLPNTIVYEDLNVSAMMKNRHLSKKIKDALWYEFRRQIEYKAQEYQNIKLLVADRWYPSSKLCNCCGNKKVNLKTQELYKCDKCGLIIDRDVNAARNLESLASL